MRLKKFLAMSTVLTLSLNWFSSVGVSANEKYNLPTDGLKGYWNFEDYEGTTVSDLSGNNRNGTIRGNGAIVDAGIDNKGLRLTGDKGTFFGIPSIINLAQENVAISFWVKIDPTSGNNRAQSTILVQQEGTGRSIAYYANTAANDKLGSFVGGSNIYGATSLKQGEWYNIIYQSNKDTKQVQLYINGKLDGKFTVPSLPNSSDPLRIGDHKNNDGFALKGIVDEVMIFNKNLTDSEIRDIYNKNATIDSLKAQLTSIIEEARETYELANTILGKEATRDYLKEIEVCESLIASSNPNKTTLIEKINTLPELNVNMQELIYGQLGDKVFISADVDNKFRTIGRELFGANHRYHKDGYGSYDTEALKVRDEFDKLYEEANFGVLRYPGGKVANLFQWKRSIGSVDERKYTIHGDPEQVPEFPYFGVDEAARYAEDKGSELVYVYNLGNGNKNDAADLVEYLNCEIGENPNGGIDWAQVRSDNGHPEPYNVTNFELGNEFQLGEQGYWVNNVSDRLGAYINGGTIQFNNQLVVEDEDWRSSKGKSNGEANQEKLIRYFPIVENTLVLTIGGTIWNRVESLANSGAENVFEYNNETGVIKFGDGTHGNIPTLNQDIKVSYSSHRDGYNDYYESMKAVDPDIKLYMSYESQEAITRMGTTNKYDGIVVHPYSGTINSNDEKYYEKILYRADEKVDLVRVYENKMIEILGSEEAKDKKVVVSEYGIFNDTSRFVKSQVNALYTAKSIIGFADTKSIGYATKHCLIDFPQGDLLGPGVQAIIQSIVNSDGTIDFVATPSAKVFTLFNTLTGTNVLKETIVNNQKLDVDGNRKLDAVETMITTDEAGNLYLMLVNVAKENVDIRVTIDGFDFTGKTGEVMLVDGPSYDAENTVDNKENVVVEESTIPAVETSYLEYTLTPHSVTAIKFNGQDVNKTDLQVLITECEQLVEGDYTETTWTTFAEALANAKEVFGNEKATQTEVNSAIDALEIARNGLEANEKAPVFKKHLEIAIEMAESITNFNDVVPVVKAEFDAALAEAKTIIGKTDASQDEVDKSFDRLSKVIQMLEFKGNKTQLLGLVEEINKLDSSEYTVESWDELQKVLTSKEVQDVIKDENALEADIAQAYTKLFEAYSKLEKINPNPDPEVNKDMLNKLIVSINGLKEEEYIATTWDNLQIVLAAAQNIANNPNATQVEVDEAYKSLMIAYLNLRLKPNKEKLQDLINGAEALDSSKYTRESFEVLNRAVKDARAVMNDTNATEQEVKTAEKNLEVAMANLQLKEQANNSSGNNGGNNNSNGGKLPFTGGTDTMNFVLVGLLFVWVGSAFAYRKRIMR